MKGIVLAGGTGSRLFPATQAVCKQLLPVYDKPMVYYPLSLLMLMGLREVLVISTPRDTPLLESLLGDGSEIGMALSYAVQEEPRGIADAFLVAEEAGALSEGERCALVLGDNILFGASLGDILQDVADDVSGATVFACPVSDPSSYGVVTIDEGENVLELEEKPVSPESNLAVPGLYVYDESVLGRVKDLQPSLRGELEITDLNKSYLLDGRLTARVLGRGFAWLDAGTFESLHEASSFVRAIEHRQGVKIGCLEEIAFAKGWIDVPLLEERARRVRSSGYGEYLLGLIPESVERPGSC